MLLFLMQVVRVMGGMFWNWDHMLRMENGPSLKLARVRHGENSRLCIKFYVPMHDNSGGTPLNDSQITRMLSGWSYECETCFQHGIRLQMEWIPRSLNDKADSFSYSGL